MRKTTAIFTGLIVAFAFSANAAPLDVAGLWLTQSGTGHVKIADCGDGTPCGKLVWIEGPDAAAQRDNNNPDTTLRDQPIVGLQLLWGFKERSSNWAKGKIYSPEKGKTYRSTIKLMDENTLQVKGCVGPFCQAQTWTRVEPMTAVGGQP
ncbi:MAG: hypothetical protein COA84_01535 [Robiginitomaculum sp.]|nr:MAG: hypothetical protein COA84_01535 [Robiginitomaculum sp.]